MSNHDEENNKNLNNYTLEEIDELLKSFVYTTPENPILCIADVEAITDIKTFLSILKAPCPRIFLNRNIETDEEIQHIFETIQEYTDLATIPDSAEKRRVIYDLIVSKIILTEKDIREVNNLAVCTDIKLATSFIKPIDNINATIWNNSQIDANEKQIRIQEIISPVSKKNGISKNVIIPFSLVGDISENNTIIETSRKLTEYDGRLVEAVYNLYVTNRKSNTSEVLLSLRQIYAQMGKGDKPSKADLDELKAALEKLRKTLLHIENTEESKVSKYKKFCYDGVVLDSALITAITRSGVSENIVQITRAPFLVQLAVDRRQYITLPFELIRNIPLSQTFQNQRLERYIFYKVSSAKNKHLDSVKLTYLEIYKYLGITDGTRRRRTKEKLHRFLDYLVEKGKDYLYKYENLNDIELLLTVRKPKENKEKT